MNKKYLIANWKMYKTSSEAIAFMQQLLPQLQTMDTSLLALYIAPAFVHLSTIAALIDDYKSIKLVAQNCHHAVEGAFTGEVSAPMLTAIGVTGVLIGHSERRIYQKENDQLLAKKIKAVVANGMQPFLCCGESLAARKSGNYKVIVQQQLEKSLYGLTTAEIKKLGIAYEPVWAIGTGKVASLEVITEMHTFIEEILSEQYNTQHLPILYGGSCNAQNAKAIFNCPNVAGGLIGSASLQADEFMKIVITLLEQ